MSLPEESVAANTLPEVTTIPTGKKLIFTDPDTNEGGIITLENLTKQILQNLTSQTFALDQGNLTLLQALNQLNSKATVTRRNDIPDNAGGISFFQTIDSDIPLGNTGTVIPAWSFCILIPYYGDAVIFTASPKIIGVAYKNNSNWNAFREIK